MKVGIIQSNYLPWRGYFDFIASVDLFVVHDDLQYTKGDWRNRNRIKTPQGSRWITVPVHYTHTGQRICDTVIDRSTDWAGFHRRLLRQNYAGTPGLERIEALLAPLDDANLETLSALNLRLIRNICDELGIGTPIVLSSEFAVQGRKTERLIEILRATGATTYLSGPAADAYLDRNLLHEANVALEYKSYDYPPYDQPWPPFDPAVSIVDLIACTGSSARDYLRSMTSDRRIMP